MRFPLVLDNPRRMIYHRKRNQSKLTYTYTYSTMFGIYNKKTNEYIYIYIYV